MAIKRQHLNQALSNLARANNEAIKWRDIIMQYSEENFGVSPGDVDCDDFIDLVDGGGGECNGMTAGEFIEAMRVAVERHNRPKGSIINGY